MIACVSISMASVVGFNTQQVCHIFFQVKARRPCTVDGGIKIQRLWCVHRVVISMRRNFRVGLTWYQSGRVIGSVDTFS